MAAENLFEQLLEVDGSTIIMSADRDPEKVAAQDHESGLPSFLSREAFDFLGQQFLAWLWSRWMRYGKSVTNVEVEVKVRFDGVEVEGGTIRMPFRPTPIADGDHRRG